MSDTSKTEIVIPEDLRWKVRNGILYQFYQGRWIEHACSQLARDIAEDYEKVFERIATLNENNRLGQELLKKNWTIYEDCKTAKDTLAEEVLRLIVERDMTASSLQSAQETLQEATGLLKEWRDMPFNPYTVCSSRAELQVRTDAILATKERQDAE